MMMGRLLFHPEERSCWRMEAGVWWQAERVPHAIVAIRLALESASCASCLGALWCHQNQKPTHQNLLRLPWPLRAMGREGGSDGEKDNE